MAIFIVPSKSYPTIQSALNVVKCGDKVEILSGIYTETLSLNGINNVTITGDNQNVIINGSTLGQSIAFNFVSSNSRISGLTFVGFGAGIFVKGNNNCINNVNSANNQLWGFLINGNNNFIQACQISGNAVSAIELAGNYNTIQSCTIKDNEYGINAQTDPCIGNIIYDNIFLRNTDYGIKINAFNADRNIIIDNSISYSNFGIYISSGKTAIVDNIINNSNDTALLITDDNMIIVGNSLTKNPKGMLLLTNNSVIARNAVSQGACNGINVTGSYNYIVQNIINGYNQIGLLVNGDYNIISNNNISGNTENTIINGSCNDTSQELCYQNNFDWYGIIAEAQKTCKYAILFNVFNNPTRAFIGDCPTCS